jgi:hypothetical protein
MKKLVYLKWNRYTTFCRTTAATALPKNQEKTLLRALTGMSTVFKNTAIPGALFFVFNKPPRLVVVEEVILKI